MTEDEDSITFGNALTKQYNELTGITEGIWAHADENGIHPGDLVIACGMIYQAAVDSDEYVKTATDMYIGIGETYDKATADDETEDNNNNKE